VHLSLAFLEHAAEDYLTHADYEALDNSWLEEAFAEGR
jgi:hypothetical protein